MLIHKGGGTLKDKTSIYSIWNGVGLKLEGQEDKRKQGSITREILLGAVSTKMMDTQKM